MLVRKRDKERERKKEREIKRYLDRGKEREIEGGRIVFMRKIERERKREK